MASRKVVTGTKAVIDALNSVNNNLNRSYFNLALETLCSEAADVARKKLIDTDHRQKYGDQLADEIGYAVKRKRGTVYTPITNTPEMRAQMYYAEYGAGITSGKGEKWLYPSTSADKNPTKFKPNGKSFSEYLAWTKYSLPARYMVAAGRYLNTNAAKRFGSAINQAIGLVRGRKPSKMELHGGRAYYEGEEE